MKNHNLKLKIFIILILAFSFTLLALRLFNKNPAEASPLNEFAQCLADKKVTMYGAEWCTHCQNQKKLFGDSFKYVPYVECPQDPQRCLAQGVDAYPTWIFPDGKKLVGEQKVEALSQESSCSLENSK